MADVLLTVSGRLAGPDVIDRITSGASRRIDYLEMAPAFGADLIDFPTAAAGGLISRLLARAGQKELSLAWECFRRRGRYRVIFTDGEQIALPLAALLKYLAFFERERPRVLMLAHDITTPKKAFFYERLGVQSHIDFTFLFSKWHKAEMQRRWGVPQEQLVDLNFMVDAHFFSMDARGVRPPPRKARPQACAVGIEARDYPTLMRAADGLAVDVIIAASSPWSHQQDSTTAQPPPANVRVDRDPRLDVRQLYADSDFVVMPLYDVDRAAGSTTILEAMAMGKAVICSRATGQRDLVVDGETGIYVPPGDVAAMRAAITHLIENPAECRRMGVAGRRRVERELSLDYYVERTTHYVQLCMVADELTLPGIPHER
jgi:glycosyltransferase involved in cell wall biosynthesis